MLTFTNKAAGEMKLRIQSLLRAHQISDMPYAGTFHSLCVTILRNHGSHINIPTNFSIYDDNDQMDALKLVMKKLDISQKQFNPRSVLATISQAKNEMISALEYPQYARGNFQETVARLYLSYQQLLVTNGALDFDDLLLKTVVLFQKRPPYVPSTKTDMNMSWLMNIKTPTKHNICSLNFYQEDGETSRSSAMHHKAFIDGEVLTFETSSISKQTFPTQKHFISNKTIVLPKPFLMRRLA